MSSPGFLYDDAYITLASAQALWAGYDPHFAGTPPLYGVTSPFHCLVVALLLPVLPPLWALVASCVAGAVAYGAGLWALARRERLGQLESAAMLVAGLGAGMVSQHLVNGLETSWAMAWVAWLLAAERGGRASMLALLAGTAPFVRPELGVLAATLLAHAIWTQPQHRTRLGVLAVAAAAPWLALLWSQTGSIVPSTLAAKTNWYAEACWPIARRLSVVGSGLWGWLWSMPIAAVGLVMLHRSPTARLAVASAATILAVWAWSVPNVLLSYQRHRYYAPFVPLLAWGLMRLPAWIRPVLVASAAMAAVLSTTSVIRFEPQAIARAMDVRAKVNLALAEAGANRVLLHDAGFLAFSHAVPVGIDMLGLKTPLAADLHAQLTGPSCGVDRALALVKLAAQTQPSHLVIWGPWDDHFQVSSALGAAGWQLDPVTTVESVEPVFVYTLRKEPRR